MTDSTLDFMPNGINRLAIRFTGLMVRGVPHRGMFHLEREDPADAFVASPHGVSFYRKTGLDEATKAAEKTIIEILIKTGNEWALANREALIKAEKTKIEDCLSRNAYEISDLQKKIAELEEARASLTMYLAEIKEWS